MQQISFPSGTVSYYFNSAVQQLPEYCNMQQVVFVTDSHVAALYPQVFAGHKTMVLPAGEHSKSMDTITGLCRQLLQMEATRSTLLVGVGGGVVTDITGFLASVYMRGVQCGFVPTTLLAMVDAAIGGKNGVDLELYKNTIGTIRQPSFILYDTQFLQTLPQTEWSNGFAEIIKYACIFDASLFRELSSNDLAHYMQQPLLLQAVINTCVSWKNNTVIADELETGQRKLLNFGHTAGHAIETLYSLPHGAAVSIGMLIAAQLSVAEAGLAAEAVSQLQQTLERYLLPVSQHIDSNKVMELLRADKKRKNDTIAFILLKSIGHGLIQPLTFPVIEQAISAYESKN